MRPFSPPAAAIALVLLAGCGVTMPWTSSSTSSTGGSRTPDPSAPGSFSLGVSRLDFSATALGPTPAKGSVLLTTTGSVYVRVSCTGAAIASVARNLTAGTIDVFPVAPAAAGTLSGTVTVRAYADAAYTRELAGSPATVNVTYVIAPNTTPTITLASGTSLTFSAPINRPAPAPQRFDVGIVNGPFTIVATPSGTAVASATVVAQTDTSATIEVTPAAPGSVAGARSGSVSVKGCVDAACTSVAQGSPKTVPVTLATTDSQFAATPYALQDVPVFAGAAESAPQSVSLDDPYGSAAWSTSVIPAVYGQTADWLKIAPASGAALPATAQVSVAFPLSTSPGKYTATIQFTSLGKSRPVTISAVVSTPGVVAPAGTVTFSTIAEQSPLPASQSLALSTQHGGSLDYAVAVSYAGSGVPAWLTAPSSGTAPGPLSLAISTAALAPGGYDATVKLTPKGLTNPPVTSIAVHYEVLAPALVSAPASATITIDPAATSAATSLSLSSGGSAPLSWRASTTQPWLVLSKQSGTTPDALGLSIDADALESLATGSYQALVDVEYDLAPGTTAKLHVPVQLDMLLPQITVVWPRVSVATVGGSVLVRGAGFAAPLTVLFGSTAATSMSVFSAGELWVSPPATLTPGPYPITVRNALGLKRSRAQLDVVASAARPAVAVPSAGTKKRIVYDDAAQILYVANAGDGTNGKVQRHRFANGWKLATDGSDEIALSQVHNLALSPDGKTLVVLAGTSWKLVDTATFTLRATQPTAAAPSATTVGLEVIQPERFVALAQDTQLVRPTVFDLATGTQTTLNAYPYLGGLAGGPDGAHLAIFEKGLSPEQRFRVFNPITDVLGAPGPAQEGQAGGYDRNGSWLLLWGGYDTAAGMSTRSRLYDVGNGYVLYGGTLPPVWSGSPPSSKLVTPATVTFAVSPKEGQKRAFTWDGTSVRAFDLDPMRLDANGVYPAVAGFPKTPAASPGSGVQMAVAADEQTAFLAGDAQVVVVPLQ